MRRLRPFARGLSLRLLVLGMAALVVTLAAAPIGQDVTLERFRRASQPTGVLCTVIASGKGFLINSTGITRVG